MEWNGTRNNGLIDLTPFLLFEASADSDDVIADFRHHHQEEEEDQEAMDDDAESCSDDHDLSLHVNSKSHLTHHQVHGYNDDHGHGHDDDDDDKNWGESKMMGQEKTCRESCVDSSNSDPGNQSDIDRQFWETCLGS